MLLSRTQLRKLIYETLTLSGRGLERAAKRIAYDVFEYLIDDDIKAGFVNQGSIGFIVETSFSDKVTWLNRVIVRMHKSPGFNSSARYEYDLNASDEDRKNSDLIIDLFLPEDYSIEEISKFRYDIESDIRHELEHSGQKTDDLMNIQSVIQSEDDIWASPENIISYYGSSVELPAHSAGWILKAKRTGQSIEDILYQELYRIYATGLDKGYAEEEMTPIMQELSNLYFNYISDRWPAQR